MKMPIADGQMQYARPNWRVHPTHRSMHKIKNAANCSLLSSAARNKLRCKSSTGLSRSSPCTT